MPSSPKLIAVLAVCVALSSAGELAAQDKDAASHLADANAAFEAGRFGDAEKALAAGLEKEPKNHALLRLRGEIRLAKRDFEGALAAYEAYLEAKPRGANRRKARKIIANLAASRTTVLEVSVAAGPANVYLDSKSIGVYCVAAPVCKKGMLPGRYRVFVERDGFHPIKQDVRLRLGKTEKVVIDLVEKDSNLTVTVVPPDARVSLDDKPAVTGQAIEVAAGEHVIEATLDGFATRSKTIKAAEGNAIVVEISLPELVKVEASVDGAALTLDGQPAQLTNGLLEIPSDGSPHTLVATAEGFRETSVTLAPDRKRGETVTLSLEKIPAVVQPPPETPPATVGWSRNRKILFGALAGVAGAGVIVGGIAGLQASSRWSDAEDRCDGDFCDEEGLDLIDDARGKANLSNVGFTVGIAALVGAGVVWLTAPSDSETPPAVSASVTPEQVGMTVRMSF